MSKALYQNANFEHGIGIAKSFSGMALNAFWKRALYMYISLKFKLKISTIYIYIYIYIGLVLSWRGVMKIRNIAARAGVKSTHPAFWATSL